MPGKPQMRTARDATKSAGPDPLAGAIAAFARVQSEPELLGLLHDALEAHFGALRAVLLTRDAAFGSANRVSWLIDGAPSLTVEIGEPNVEKLLADGEIFATDAPEADLPGVPVPDGARRAILVPCSGAESRNAVCAFWRDGGRAPGKAGRERLRLLASMAGLAFERQLMDLRGRMLRADLDNRIRNVLAVIRSVGTRSAERAVSMDDFLLHFEGRIDAIGRSQITAGRAGEISFELLLREELLAQTIQDDTNVSLEGMDVSVNSEQAEALGLAIHELAVNAVKFGAFADPSGGLAVRWWVESDETTLALNIDWRESLGPQATVAPPTRAGFGLTYIEHALPFQLNAEVTTDFTPAGLRCQISVPLGRAPGVRARWIPSATAGAGPRPATGARRKATEDLGLR
jgi:two-component sensor histidine kinase